MFLVAAITLLIAAAADQVAATRPRRIPRHPFVFPRRVTSGEHVQMVRVIYVDLSAVHAAGLLPEYEAMRDFLDRSFSCQEIDALPDLRDGTEMWIWLPAPPMFQKKDAFRQIVERWPFFVDPELASFASKRVKTPYLLREKNLPIPSSTRKARFYVAVSDVVALSSWPSLGDARSAVRRLPLVERDIVIGIVEVDGSERRMHPKPPPMEPKPEFLSRFPDDERLFDAFVAKYDESGLPLDTQWMYEKARELRVPGEAVSKMFALLSRLIGPNL